MGANITVRKFTERDALPLSILIGRTLIEENIRDYSLNEIEELAAMYNPQAIKNIAAEGHLYTAVDETGKLLGCGAVSPHSTDENAVWVHALFTHHQALGQGVGRAVMAALEADPLTLQAKTIDLDASLTAEGFYKHLGYTYLGGTRTVADGVVPMQKRRQT